MVAKLIETYSKNKLVIHKFLYILSETILTLRREHFELGDQATRYRTSFLKVDKKLTSGFDFDFTNIFN